MTYRNRFNDVRKEKKKNFSKYFQGEETLIHKQLFHTKAKEHPHKNKHSLVNPKTKKKKQINTPAFADPRTKKYSPKAMKSIKLPSPQNPKTRTRITTFLKNPTKNPYCPYHPKELVFSAVVAEFLRGEEGQQDPSQP